MLFMALSLVYTNIFTDDLRGADDRILLRVYNYLDSAAAHSEEEIIRIWGAFEQANPDIQIVREDLCNEAYHNKLQLYTAAESLPDIIYVWTSEKTKYLYGLGLLKNLSPLVIRDNLASLYHPAALDPAAQSGGYLGVIPWGITSSHVFFVNKAVLKDAGLTPAKTYAELKAQAPILKAKGYDTILMANQDPWVMASCLFSMLAGRFSGEDWEQNILTGTAKFTDSNFVRALGFVKTLVDDGVLAPTTFTTSYGEVATQFAANKGAYFIDGDWRINAFITDPYIDHALIPPDEQRNIQLTVFPDIEGVYFNQSTSVMISNGWAMNAAIPAGSPKEAAAWRLITWLSGKEVQSYHLETSGIATPSRIDIKIGTLQLEPLQKAGGKLSSKHLITTPVIDAVFDSRVYKVLTDGLHLIGLGLSAPEEVAEQVQRAFDQWKAQAYPDIPKA
jgi:raffinose/stachyose/melibiose transport system substrate-binding protein